MIVSYATTGGTLLLQVNYVYDVFGNRIEKDVTAGATTTVTRFTYDQGNVWADLDGSNNLVTRREYLDGVDQVFARMAAGGATAFYLTDRLGSVRDITDATGAVQDHLNYDGFGNVLNETNPAFGDRYRYTGREFDVETGLQYNRARYYDPTTGRWSTQDPEGVSMDTLSTRAQLDRAETAMQQIRTANRQINSLLALVRRNHDIVQIECIQTHLLEVRRLLKVADQAFSDLESALMDGNSAAAASAYATLEATRDAVARLRADAELCTSVSPLDQGVEIQVEPAGGGSNP
jgi:RHS repeat-associated protein